MAIPLSMPFRAGILAIALAFFSVLAQAEKAIETDSQATIASQSVSDTQPKPQQMPEQTNLVTNPKFRLKDDPESSAAEEGGQSVVTMILGLFAVLAVIAGLAWLSKRFNLSLPGASADMKLLGAMSIGSKEKLLLVEVEGSKLLLGVTPHQVSLIKSFDEGKNKSGQSEFSDKMQLLLKSGMTNDS